MITFIYGEIANKNKDAARAEAVRVGFEISEKMKSLRGDFVAKNGRENAKSFDASTDDIRAISREILNTDLFASRKFFMIQNALMNAEIRDVLVDNLARVPEENDLILTELKPDKRIKLFKDLVKKTNTIVAKDPTRADLKKDLDERLRVEKTEMKTNARDELLLRISGDKIPRARLMQELDKLTTLAMTLPEDAREITIADVQKIVDADLDANVFQIMNFAIDHERDQVADEIVKLRAGGEDANRFLGLLTTQILALAAAKFANSAAEATQKLKIAPFQLTKAQTTARKMTVRQVREMTLRLAQTDAKLKRNNSDDSWLLLEKFLGEL